MIWADPLNDGPVPGNVSDDELLRVRAAFLAGTPDQVDEVAADLTQWRAAIDDHDSYDELVLWFEHDLFDQLNLIQLLAHLGMRQPSKPVTMVQIDSYPGHPDFKGIGELAPADVAALFETRRPVTPEQLALAATRVERVSIRRSARDRTAAAGRYVGAALSCAGAVPASRGISVGRRRPVAQRTAPDGARARSARQTFTRRSRGCTTARRPTTSPTCRSSTPPTRSRRRRRRC